MTNLTRAEKRLLQELEVVKRTRKALLESPASPLNDRAQDSWERGVITMIIKYCDSR